VKKALTAACAVRTMKCLNKHFIAITAIMVIGLFGLSATANRQETSEAFIPDFAVMCTNTGQLCDPRFPCHLKQGRFFRRGTSCAVNTARR
jgi:hypothetical protein